MSLSEALPTTAIDTVRVYTPKRYRQLQVKDLPKVPTWWLERVSNSRPSGRKALTLPMRHHAPTAIPCTGVVFKDIGGTKILEGEEKGGNN